MRLLSSAPNSPVFGAFSGHPISRRLESRFCRLYAMRAHKKRNLETLKLPKGTHDLDENKEPSPEGEPKTNRHRTHIKFVSIPNERTGPRPTEVRPRSGKRQSVCYNDGGTNYAGMAAELGNLIEILASRRRLKLVIFFVTSVCNARCRTCFYWEELNQRGDLTWDEIQKLSRSMPRFSDLWLSGGEPMLRKELPEILHLFYENNGIRWTNLPTNGLLPERTAEWTARICRENQDLQLDLNVALDGLHEMQDSIRAVPGNFQKTLQTLEMLQPCREKFSNLRVNINTVVCAENFDRVTEIVDFVWKNCAVDGHYFNIIRGNAKDEALKQIPSSRLPALFREIQQVYTRYAPRAIRRKGFSRKLAEAYYSGTLAFHNQVQLENIESPHAWPMPCTASETSVVIDYNGDVRACELRSKLGNLREFDCDFARFWDTLERRQEAGRISHDQCWCTHVCFIHDSLRHSPKVLAFDIPLAYLQSRFQPGADNPAPRTSRAAASPARET